MKHIRITVEGKTYEVDVEVIGEQTTVTNIAAAPAARPMAPVAAAPVAAPAPKKAPVAAGAGDIVSPLSAVVISIDVSVGQTVSEGDNVAVIEAMKMNNVVTATASGTVKAIHVKVGEALQEGQLMLTLG